MKLFFTINDKEYAVEFDYKVTTQGCSSNGWGEPGWGTEWEIDGDLTLTAVDAPKVELEIPEWLNKQLTADIYEDTQGTIQEAIENNEALND